MSPPKKRKLDAAIDNLFSEQRMKTSQEKVAENTLERLTEVVGASVASPEASPAATVIENAAEALPIELTQPKPVQPEGEYKATPYVTPMKTPDLSPAQLVPDITQENGASVQMIIFTLDEQYYGVGIEVVDSIIKMQPITELPRAPHFIVGLTNLRGKVLPVISLRKRFGIADQETTKSSRIIVINVEQKEAGIIVDSVSEVETIPRKNIETAPSMTATNSSRPIEGIAKLADRLIILLNLAKVILPAG